MSWDKNKFKNTLDSAYNFPCSYTFKFIVISSKKSKVLNLISNPKFIIKESRNKKYISITLTSIMKNADEIIYIYKKASKIKGIISL